MIIAQVEPTQRVCVSCGCPPGEALHCANCGTNLLWKRRLPTRGEWEEARGKVPPSQPDPRQGLLRYSARELTEKHKGPRRFKRGRLMLLLTLNEILEAEEELEVFFSATEQTGLPCWLAVSTKRLYSIPDRPAAATERRSPKGHLLTEIEHPRCRRRPFSSRFYFSTKSSGKLQYSMRGTTTAASLVELLTAADD